MSRSIKKRLTSTSYFLNRLYHGISTMKPSILLLSIVAIAIAIFLVGGGLYNLIVQPFPSVYYGGRFVLVDPRLSDQFISDSMVATILYSLGTIGLVFVYQSTKYAYKPRQAYMTFIVGIILLFLAYTFLEAEMNIKIGG